MMMFDRNAKLSEFQKGLRSGNPRTLARVMALPPVASAPQQSSPPAPGAKVNLQHPNGTDWSTIVSHWLDAYEAAVLGYPIECNEKQAALHNAFNQLFASSKGNTLIPTLHAVCKNSHRVALAADAGASDQAKLQNAVTLLQESYSRTINDRKEWIPDAPFDEEGSKKAGVLAIVNELFSIYFELNTLRLCKNLLRPVEAKKLHLSGPMGQLVTYRYYVGRINLFEDSYEEAEKNLQYAFEKCHVNSLRNKRCILRYLVPIKLFRGRLPSSQLLTKYGLVEFAALSESIRKGDLRSFNEAILRYQHRFISQGTYLLLEKCKPVCYRNLFKRIHLVLDSHQIALSNVANAFKWLGMPIDLDEVECILANLIYRQLVRGYLSHSKRVLVLSKRDPFPVDKVISR